MLKRTSVTALNRTYCAVPSCLSETQPHDFYDLVVPERLPVPQVLDAAWVSSGGLIFQGLKLSRFSNFYAYQTPAKVFRSFREHAADYPRIPEAWLVSQQIVYKGSYGDYWDEFLTTFCAHRPPPGSTILVAENFSSVFAEEDLADAKYPTLRIPAAGVKVDRLHVLPPAQFFNNYIPKNVEAIRAMFPDRIAPAEKIDPKKFLYLSRRGFVRTFDTSNGKSSRTFQNEEEVENFLAARGFRIIHPHHCTNAEIRAALAGAHTIVAPHGAALFHTVWSPPRRIIELAHHDWYLPSFIKLAHAMGVPEHRILPARDGTVDVGELEKMLAQ